MKTNLCFVLATFCLHFTLLASGGKDYEEKMKTTLAKMKNFSSVETVKETAHQFAEIGKVEKEEWLPWYYHANAYIMLIYMDSTATLEEKDQYLDTAAASVKKILEQHPEEAEIHLLHAWYLVSRLGLDPMTRGEQYYGLYKQAINKAQYLEPQNPRVKFFQVVSSIGEAQYAGQPVAHYCPELQALLDDWDNYTPKSSLHPDWGKEEVKQKMAEVCQ